MSSAAVGIDAGLQGRSAIVTGGASGIGRATARRLAAAGARIAVVDVDDDWGRETVQLITEAGGDSFLIHADVSKEKDVVSAVTEATTRFSGLDILINNVGIVRMARIVDMDEDEWDRVLDTNLKGAFLMSKHALPHLIQRGGGAIINTASDAGLVGFANLGAYCASKGGLIQLTRAMALEYGEHFVRVNAVAPTSTLHTRMLDGFLESAADGEAIQRALEKSHPLPRLGTAEEVAELITYLAGDQGSYITGAVLSIDGGLTAASPVAEF
jgi:NAD(P)-dependent dehydrogenase (short-subunit alcohol dehydrogenase family)